MVNSNNFNEDELNPPEWINRDFFKQILEKLESETVKINDLEVSPGSVKNDHYGSVMFRAKLKYVLTKQPTQDKFRSFVMKTEPTEDGVKREKLGEMPLFATEVRMYTEVLPKIESLLRTIGDETVLGPQLFYYSLESPQCVVFEDLVEEGYTTINNRPCSFEEVKIALLKLAKLHAISFKLGKEGDHNITTFDKSFMNAVNIDTFPVIKDGTKLLKNALSEQADLRQYVPLIEHAERFLLPKTLEMFNAYKNGKRDGIQVLNHGDFHVKNVMVKNVGGKLKDLMLLDYQCSIFGSAAIDLHYAYAMMYSPDMRREHQDELLYYYITNFQSTLRKIAYSGHIPTINEMREEIQQYRHWGLFMLLSFLIFNYAFVDDSVDLGKLVELEEERRVHFSNPKMLNELRVLLPRFLHFGYFEE